jgi:hypothetical protein
MIQRILFNFASRSRPEKLKACIENIESMVTGANHFICAKIDKDDNNDYSFLDRERVSVAKGVSRSKINAINRSMPCGWDILINTSDDILFTEKGFDDIIRAEIGQDTFLHFPEEYADSQAQNKERDTISVVSIMDRVYYDRFGYVYHPDYISLWCDNEATEVARRLGRYKHVNKKIFEHLHPAAGKAETDAQYRKTESYYQKDKRTFERRKAENFYL